MQNEKQKKVLLLITKSNWGGAQRYVYDLAVFLHKENHTVRVACGGDGILIKKLENAGISSVRIPSLGRDVSIKKEIQSFIEIWQIIRDEKPSVLHINSSKVAGMGVLIGRLLGVPKIIFTAHGWAFNEERSQIEKLIFKVIYWVTIFLSHTTIAVSEKTKQQMEMFGIKKKMKVVHNGCEIQGLLNKETAKNELISLAAQLGQYRGDFWSATIGELHPIKQHDVTIKALSTIVKKYNNVRHIIIGDGEQRKYLEDLIRSYKLENHIFLLGHVDEAAKYLSAFDLFVLSSRSEALAYVIIEASIAELPIVASAVGGIPEIITNNENGLLVSPGDVNALIDAYEKILTDIPLKTFLAKNAATKSELFKKGDKLAETVTFYK